MKTNKIIAFIAIFTTVSINTLYSQQKPFELSLSYFQNTLTNKLNRADIEKSLIPYKAAISKEEKTLSYNEKTDKHDIPNWEINYLITYKKEKLEIVINYEINESMPISNIGVYLPKHSLVFDEKSELKKNSYHLSEEIYGNLYYDNNKFTTVVFYNDLGYKSIETYITKE